MNQNTENLMKIGWKIRKFRNFSRNISVQPVDMNHANEWVDDVIASQLLHDKHFYSTEMTKIS